MATHFKTEAPVTPLADGEIRRLNYELMRSYERHAFGLGSIGAHLSPLGMHEPIVVQRRHEHGTKTG